jgi:L-aspartate oxidase
MLTQPLPPGAKLTNADGEEFLAGYLHDVVSPEECLAQRNRHNPFSTRDDLSRYVDFAIIGEVKTGRSTQRGGVYLDISASPPSGPGAKFWEYRGIDFSAPVEIGVCQHCSLGGLRIDANGQTTVPRLYAAGEAAAGPHGADRMGGHMLLASQVFGARAGRHAAANTLGKNLPGIGDSIIKDTEAKIDMYRDLNGRYSPSQVKLELQRSAYFNLLVIRTRKGLTGFLADVARIGKEMGADISVWPG